MPSDADITPELFVLLKFRVSQFLHESLVSFFMDITLLRKLTNTFEHSKKNVEVEAL